MKRLVKFSFIIPGLAGMYFALRGLFSLKEGEIKKSDTYFLITLGFYFIAAILLFYFFLSKRSKVIKIKKVHKKQ